MLKIVRAAAAELLPDRVPGPGAWHHNPMCRIPQAAVLTRLLKSSELDFSMMTNSEDTGYSGSQNMPMSDPNVSGCKDKMHNHTEYGLEVI